MWLAMKLEHAKKKPKNNNTNKKYTCNVLEPSLEIAITYWILVH
jgi:hypothetical protein